MGHEKADAPLAEFKEDQISDWCVAFLPSARPRLCKFQRTSVCMGWRKKRTEFPIGASQRLNISVSPDGKQVAVADINGKQAELYDVESGQLLVNLCIVTGGDPAKYRGDAYRMQRYLRRLERRIPIQLVGPIIFSPCGTVLAAGSWDKFACGMRQLMRHGWRSFPHEEVR